MSKKIILDSGHGYNTPGKRTPNDVREWTMNDAVCRYAAAALADYDVEVLRCDDITGKTDIAVQKRTDAINSVNPDLFVSIHHNGNTGEWGDWSYVCAFYNVNKPKRDADLAVLFAAEVSKQTGIRNNGGLPDTKSAVGSLHMVRETKSSIPSVLIEGGFMDSRKDEPIITSTAGQKAYGQAVANVCIAYLGLQKKNASNANETSTVGTIPQNSGTQTPIMGKPSLTAEQMSAFLLSKNPAPLIVKCTPLELAKLYLSEGNTEGVRGDIAFAQAIQETGWFRFGNDVLPEQNNYCGLGATGNGERGEKFTLPQVGVRVHIQHLKAYACTDSLRYTCVDPRFEKVTRGVAPNWVDLNGKWAMPGVGYGEKILAIYADMAAFKTKEDNVMSGNTQTIQVTIGATKYIVDGKALDRDTLVYKGEAYIPAAYLADKLGYTAVWDAKTNTTTLTRKKQVT